MTNSQLESRRANPYLAWMFVAGLILTTAGTVWTLVALSVLSRSVGSTSVPLLAQIGAYVGPSVGGFGLLLLFTSWVIAAAKFH